MGRSKQTKYSDMAYETALDKINWLNKFKHTNQFFLKSIKYVKFQIGISVPCRKGANSCLHINSTPLDKVNEKKTFL